MKAEFRVLQQSDLPMLLQWRNHEQIRSFMFQQHEIGYEEHLKWFESNRTNPERVLLIYFENSEPTGFMQFKALQSEQNVLEWGFYINPESTAGTGSRMCSLAIAYAFNELAANKVYGEVLGFNHASLKLHHKLGFREEACRREQPETWGKNHSVHCFGLLKDEWQTNQAKL